MASKRTHDDSSDPASEPIIKRPRSNFTDVIRITVTNDENSKTFMVYDDLICSRSQTIEDIRSARLPDATSKPAVEIKHTILDDFTIYLEWLVSDVNNLTELAKAQVKPRWAMLHNETAPRRTETLQLAGVIVALTSYWKLGETLKDRKFQNCVVDTLLRQDTTTHPGTIVQSAIKIGKTFAKTTGLWNWAVDCVARKATIEQIEGGAEKWPTEFTSDVMKELVRLRGMGNPPGFPRIADRQKYHEQE